jgi:uncharacterized protein YndB with AHSA1/START domain
MTSSTDRIEKRIELRAPQARVWRAISDPAEFGSWFGMELDGAFTPGAELRGRIVPTTADPEIAKMQQPHVGKPVVLFIDRVEPMHTFSYRWHPFAIDPAVDYSSEPMTLVTFTLERAEDGTVLTILETGFDAIPLARRADAFEANDEGWALMTELLGKYLAASP